MKKVIDREILIKLLRCKYKEFDEYEFLNRDYNDYDNDVCYFQDGTENFNFVLVETEKTKEKKVYREFKSRKKEELEIDKNLLNKLLKLI